LAARELGDTLVVLVNDDRYLERKKGYRVLSQDQRCRLIANLRPVTIVIPHTMVSDKDTTVNDALRRIRPNIFAKGTDIQDINQVPENQVMTELGGCVRVGVGNTTGAQTHSSDLVARVLKKLQK
jgi:bifunctional ADP-heptose synthase (sugar kinase/adenylyltransferase)